MNDEELMQELSDVLWDVYHNYQDILMRWAMAQGKRADDFADLIPSEHKATNRRVVTVQTLFTNPHLRDELKAKLNE